MSIALLVVAFVTGGLVSLALAVLARALARRRIDRAAASALTPEQLNILRGYIGEIDNAEHAHRHWRRT